MNNYCTTSFDLKLALLQYFRYRRQWICVDEFRGADIIADTGTEIIEAEIKVTKNDLVNGERAKSTKHHLYKMGKQYARSHPNKFMFCVPEKLVDDALAFAERINENYGVIAFDAETFEKRIKDIMGVWHCNYLRIVKSAKQLHGEYKNQLRWAIAMRVSAKNATLVEMQFKKYLQNNLAPQGESGKQLAYAISELANLMYQRNTKKNFYKSLIIKLQDYADQRAKEC